MSEELFGPAWRWNWRQEHGALEVCRGEHRKHDPCDFELATESDKRLHDEIEEFRKSRATTREESRDGG